MILCIFAYTCMLVVLWPATWMDPRGGMARNLAVLPALAMSWVLSERR
ncbi:nucleoside-diphosphate-sugar epimerase [Pseudoxanthomonas suwonensis 11-1]|uniref:Nucleoside-diphosphate-sugar epimerase n=1 Tax=Pseudoxanthomonas suwonensis (strain 11-1) TaxID=743721 RepID=E6WPU5_PSEUU|nr:nucleoside-diphosphate-sugar epimerase [Pseudoxanthomonas suwonensis 11-1]